MSQIDSIKLQTSCILNVPFENSGKDFSFIVNDEEYKASKIISDLISPYISKIHSTDPTFDRFHINTKQRGDFSNILQLINFKTNRYPEKELPFLLEVIEILNNDSIKFEKRELTIDNAFDNIEEHEKYSEIYRPLFSQEIEFISSHISEILESKEEELVKLSKYTLYSILSNDQIQLKNEDELLKFINKLYTTDEKYSILYETVLFENVSIELVSKFVSIFYSELMTCGTWKRLTVRLCKEIKNDSNSIKRYTKKKNNLKGITFSKDNEYDGIINYLRKKSNGQIENEIKITASSIFSSDECNQPRVVTLFDDNNKFFCSNNESNAWLCFDFKEHRIIPTDYTIRSFSGDPNYSHLKSWVVECSNDNDSRETVDEEKDCPYLNGKNYSHTFTMNQ